jgi:hypothetical protein
MEVFMPMIKLLVLLCVAVMLSGCASGMALQKNKNSLELSGQSIALMTVRIYNENKPECQPSLTELHVDGPTPTTFQLYRDDVVRKGNPPYAEYYVSLALTPGPNKLEGQTVIYKSFLKGAVGVVSLDMNILVKPDPVQYLGRVTILIRKKKNDEEKSVGVHFSESIVDAGGFYTGAVDVSVEDKFDEDMKVFKAEYPVLRNVKVEKNILPQWIRPEKRRSW